MISSYPFRHWLLIFISIYVRSTVEPSLSIQVGAETSLV